MTVPINETAFLSSYTRPMQKEGKLKKVGTGKNIRYQTVEQNTD